MERLTQRAYILAAGMAVFGGVLFAQPKANYPVKTEQDMEKLAPSQVGEFRFFGSDENPQQSYRMGQMSYDTLKPFGIVARQFSNGEIGFDAVLIAGNDVNSFHDPRVCFTAQGYAITEERRVTLETKTRGGIPATYAKLMGPRGASSALFLYRGPSGFASKTRDLKLDMFKARLLNHSDVDGVFYRFIPYQGNPTEDDLFNFVRDFIDEAQKTSDGYF